MRDPLDPALIPELIRGILYVWPVRCSLGRLHSSCSKKRYEFTRANTSSLLKTAAAVDGQEDAAEKVIESENAVIAAEDLWKVLNLRNEDAVVSRT
jgi:hypothetical protein